MKKRYNIEIEGNQEIRDMLKSLPHIQAPENFESELKRKLNTLKTPVKQTYLNFYFRRALMPAAAFALTSLILFFLVNSQPDDEYINPFNSNPPVRINNEKNNPPVNLPFTVTSNDVIMKENYIPEQPERVNELQSSPLTSSPNSDILYKKRLQEFIANNQGGNVDRSLRAKPGMSPGSTSGTSTVNFNGFNIIQEDDRTLDELRARMDSIKKLMRNNDRR